MDARHEIGANRSVNRPMLRQPWQFRQGTRANPYPKMGFAFGPCTGMARVLRAFVKNLQQVRLQTGQIFPDFVHHRHFSVIPPVNALEIA